MEAQAINEWTLNLSFLSVFIIVLFVMMLIYRIRNNNLCSTNMLCEFKTDEGTGYKKFMPIKEGKLYIEPTKKRMGALYPVGDVVSYLVDYPDLPGFFKVFSFIQSKAKKAVFDESTAEPLTNRSPLCLITPQRLFNMDREKFTAIATRQSKEDEKRLEQGKAQAPMKLSLTTVIMILAIGGIAIVAVLLFQNMDSINAALGIP